MLSKLFAISLVLLVSVFCLMSAPGEQTYPRPSLVQVYPSPPVTASDTVSNFYVSEEWCGGVTAEGTIGTHGWFTEFDTGPGNKITRKIQPDANHPCSISFVTGTTSGTGIGTYLDFCGSLTFSSPGTCIDVGTSNTFPPLASTVFDSLFIFELSQTTSECVMIGYFDFQGGIGPTCAPIPVAAKSAVGMYLDTSVSAAFKYFSANDSSVATTVGGLTPTANVWIKVRIRGDGTQYFFSACQGASSSAGCVLGAESSINTNLSTHSMTPQIWIHSLSTTSDELAMSFWYMQMASSR